MKIINVLDCGTVVATMLTNEDAVGITLLSIRSAVHPDRASDINVQVADPDNLADVLLLVGEGLNP